MAQRKISVVISSLRPDRLEETIDSTAMHSDLVEVVVVSPTPPKPRDFVRHIPVPAPGEPGELTFTQKFNVGAKAAECEYVAFNNDDIHFRPGWAPALLQHMEQEKARPYLAGFHLAVRGSIHTRYTAFGLLYANLGCIRKRDLELIGGQLFDERLYMYTSDIDLGLRVWSQGGKVGLCPEVVLDADRDVDQVSIAKSSIYVPDGSEGKPRPARTYRDVWFDHDSAVFFDKWFKNYFWLFLRNYPQLRNQFTNEDGVLPPKRHQAGLLKIMLWPVFNLYLSPKRWFQPQRKVDFVRRHWVRVVNRRWRKMDYQLPYPPAQVLKTL